MHINSFLFQTNRSCVCVFPLPFNIEFLCTAVSGTFALISVSELFLSALLLKAQ